MDELLQEYSLRESREITEKREKEKSQESHEEQTEEREKEQTCTDTDKNNREQRKKDRGKKRLMITKDGEEQAKRQKTYIGENEIVVVEWGKNKLYICEQITTTKVKCATKTVGTIANHEVKFGTDNSFYLRGEFEADMDYLIGVVPHETYIKCGQKITVKETVFKSWMNEAVKKYGK